MRLTGCVALELALGATVVAAAGGAALWGAEALRSEWEGRAHAAESRAASSDVADVVTGAERARLRPTRSEVGLFRGVSDEILLAPLREARIDSVRVNRGGSSISLRLDFENGARAAFKPQQDAWQTVPRREVAAFRLNRLLGLRTVPPAIGRRFPAEEVLENLGEESQVFLPELEEKIEVADGEIVGELSWWIPIIRRARLGGFKIDETDGIVTWTRYLSAGEDIPPEDRELLSQISDLVLFDFIINNGDRWSGGNARISEDGSLLYSMDNTFSFAAHPSAFKARAYLKKCQKFSRSLVAELRDLRLQDVRGAVSEDLGPFPYLLTDHEIAGVLDRRDQALDYIDGLIALHGEEAVLVFP